MPNAVEVGYIFFMIVIIVAVHRLGRVGDALGAALQRLMPGKKPADSAGDKPSAD